MYKGVGVYKGVGRWAAGVGEKPKVGYTCH